MRVNGWATVAVVCALVTPGALAQNAAPPESEASSQSRPAPSVWPKWLPPIGTLGDSAGPPAPWSAEEIELAQVRCAALLKGLSVVAVPQGPIRDGGECGAPAPMQLISIGNSPQIALSPPPTVTCEMIAALHKWLLQDLQPLARKYLGAPVIRIETMSSYSCRNAYGRANARLSEHGRANALDLGAFITARGHNALVASDWGPTAREIRAAAASSEGKAAEHAPQRAGERPPGGGWRPLATRPPEPAPPVALGLQQPGPVAIPGLTVDWLGASGREGGLTLGPPSRLGGPKPASTQAAEVPVLPGGKMDFLRSAHRAACKIFGTVLGPEANSAHRNHFHLDMAERKVSVICE